MSNINIDITISKGIPPFTNKMDPEGSEGPTLTTHHAYIYCSLNKAIGNHPIVIRIRIVIMTYFSNLD